MATLPNALLDEAGMLAAADPAAAAVFPVLPDLHASIGAAGLRALGGEALDQLGELPMPNGVTRVVGDVRTFMPDTATRDDTAIFWIHGGGLIAGEPRQNDLLCAALALEHGVPVFAGSYRLAPEHPYPAGLDDCLAGLRSVLTSFPRVVIAGASAGGGLAVATAMRARDEGLEGLVGLIAYYPMLDDRPGRASMERITYTKTWHTLLDRMAWDAYLHGLTDVPAYAAPARATTEELRGLPPTFIDVGTLDGFFDEDLAFVAALARAGVPVELCVTPGAFHASENLAPAAHTSQRIAAFRSSAYARSLA